MSLGAFNQVYWSGVGDVDECWIIATYWALVASGVMRREDLPSIRRFRALAGNPDRPGSTGGNNSQLLKALKAMKIPTLDVVKFDGGRDAFKRMLQKGYIASLSVWSGALPNRYQFGYRGAHQISVYYKGGKFYIMNPLQKSGSPLMQINYNSLVYAANALGAKGWSGNPMMHAIFIRSKADTSKKKAMTKPPVGFMPQRPRDLNAPIVVRNYLDPSAPAKLYRSRHEEQ